MSRVYERFGTRITAQASALCDVDANDGFSTGTLTQVDKASSGNGDGAQWFDVYVDVTSAPSAAATCELWTSGSSDGTDESDYEYALSVAIPAAADQYHLGALYSTPREFNAKIKGLDYDFTATLYIVPVYYADA